MSIEIINKELKEKLGDELYKQVEEKLGDSDVVIETKDNFIPKKRFDEVNEKAKKVDEFADYEEIKAERDELKENVEKYSDYDELKEKAAKIEEYSDYEDLKEKTTKLEKNNKALKLRSVGVDPDFTEFVMEKIGDSEDFDEAAKKFVEENPKFRAENFKDMNSSLDLGGNSPKDPSEMSDEEYLDWRKSHDVDGRPVGKN